MFHFALGVVVGVSIAVYVKSADLVNQVLR